MGRQNSEFHQQFIVDVAVEAPDLEEAGRRFEDTRDVLSERFGGAEIYRPRDGGPSWIPGHPRFLRFTLAEEGPEGAIGHDNDLSVASANIVARIVEKGLIPEDEEIDELVKQLRQQVPKSL